MSVLVIAEHEQGALKPETAKVINAAAKISDNITVLVAGHSVATVAESASKIAGVTAVIVADKPVFEHQLAESTADLVVELAADYSHILASASTTGKNTLPRVAALLDKSQISEIIDVIDADTFKRPIYAGNAIATVKSAEDKKIITVRASAFDAQGEQAAVAVSSVESGADNTLSEFVSVEQTESERPELNAAPVVISGGVACRMAKTLRY